MIFQWGTRTRSDDVFPQKSQPAQLNPAHAASIARFGMHDQQRELKHSNTTPFINIQKGEVLQAIRFKLHLQI